MFKCFATLHYAAPEEYPLQQCVPEDAMGFHRKCADLCIKHKKVTYNWLIAVVHARFPQAAVQPVWMLLICMPPRSMAIIML